MQADVRDHGATGDGTTNDAGAIQRAMDACAEAGGGSVVLPAGEYLSGTLTLRSNVHLEVSDGAVLKASTKREDYVAGEAHENDRTAKLGFLLHAENADRVSIGGRGVILGPGEARLLRPPDPDPLPDFRVGILRMMKCRDVRMRDVTIRYSDWWTLHFWHCERLWIDGIAIRNNPDRRNTDGIDPDSCRDVHISNCHIVAGDDCICLKASDPTPCENVVVTNCTMETTATAIKFGTGTAGDIRHVHISNCVIRNSSGAVGFFLKDGGTIESISLTDITCEDRENDRLRHLAAPFFMDIERRYPESKVGVIRDVTVSNVRSRGRNGFLIQGMPESPIRNLTLRDVSVRINGATDFANRMKRVGGRRTTSDERDTLYATKPSCVTIAHVDGLTVENLRAEIDSNVYAERPRTALWTDHVANATLGSVTRSPDGEGNTMPVMRDGSA